jgi:hypothetical protein
MLLEDDNVNAGAREQETKHEPARSTSNDAVTGGECSNCITSLGRTHLDKVVLFDGCRSAPVAAGFEMRAPRSLAPA